MEIIPGIHLIEYLYSNCYLYEGENLILIDTGLPGTAKHIRDYIRKTIRSDISELKTIVLTHGDFDHIGSAKELKRLSGAQVAAHREEIQLLSMHKKRSGPPDAPWNVRLTYRGLAAWQKLTGKLPLEVDLAIEDGQVIGDLRVIHLPGHTPGSIALYEEGRRVLFSGDSLVYPSGVLHGSPPNLTMCPGKIEATYRKLLAIDFDIMLGGHGQPLMSGAVEKVRRMGIVSTT
jgi:glyoxylase-like metal-dependent hydrolase (beta-lactamase superfamily II)